MGISTTLGIGPGLLYAAFGIAGIEWWKRPGATPARHAQLFLLEALLVAGVLIGGWLRRARLRAGEREHALVESETRHRALLEQAADSIFVVDEEFRLTQANQRAVEMLGWSSEELVGRPVSDLIDPEDLRRTPLRSTAVAQGNVVLGRRTMVRRDGVRFPVEVSVRRLTDGRTQAIVRDMSERERADRLLHETERALWQAQKLEAVGRLAGGVAHDFNNLLTVVQGNVQLLERSLTLTPEDRSLVREIGDAAMRGAALTRQLLAFGRRQDGPPQPVRVHDVVETVRRMLERLLGPEVELGFQLEATEDLVLAEPIQLEQVLMNLAVNARDAMPRGGRVSIETRDARGREVPNGRSSIVLVVRDTGAGMDEQTQHLIFEPFFTTKPPGSGTGLGLATVYGIVNRAGGTIRVTSAPGHGTTFEVLLPLVGDAPPPGDGAAVHISRGQHEPATTGRLMLVEDDDSVRSLSTQILESAGYVVMAYATGDAALRAAQTDAPAFDVLLTDFLMPGLGGRELATRMSVVRPGVPVVFVTAFAGDAPIAPLADGRPCLVVSKPFTAEELLHAVASARARSAGAAH